MRGGARTLSRRAEAPDAPLARSPEPLGDDRLVAGAHRRAVMQRVVVAAAIGTQVVPYDGGALFGRHGKIDVDELGLAARFDVVQVDHEGPGALAERTRRVALELVGLEVIGVRLELLGDLVVLALARLGHRRIDAHGAADALVEHTHCLLAAYE